MALISQTLTYANDFREKFGMERNQTWTEMAENVLLIRENDVTLEYTTMNNSVLVKQADVVLNTYPLDYTMDYPISSALNDLDYVSALSGQSLTRNMVIANRKQYALKQSPDGPAMTYAIFSIVANEVSPSGCSGYTYAQYSYLPYLRGPFHQLSEQLVDDYTENGGTHPAYPFLTGHGGANQVALFGYLGLRILPDDKIHIDPNLPPQVPQVKYRTFYWRGWPISARSNYTHTTISRAMTIRPLDTASTSYRNSSIEVIVGTGRNAKTYKLPANGTAIVVENRKIGSKSTLDGNLIQCQPASSKHSFVPGQFPISINDGAASTKWQPEFANNISSVTITVPQSDKAKKITGFYFDWGQAPPSNVTVILHDSNINDDMEAQRLASLKTSSDSTVTRINVTVSNPWSAKSNLSSIAEISIPQVNTTNFTFAQAVPLTRFATLFVEGNQGLNEVDVENRNGTGATIAEWAILSD